MFIEYAQLLLISCILGGMVCFQLLFAPMIFIKLPEETARPFIRKFFPYYYLYFALLSLILSFVNYALIENPYGIFHFAFAVIILIGFLVSRQVFMPLANKATDQGDSASFKKYHRITVVVNSLQMLTMAISLWLL